MDDEHIVHYRCRACGKWFSETDASQSVAVLNLNRVIDAHLRDEHSDAPGIVRSSDSGGWGNS